MYTVVLIDDEKWSLIDMQKTFPFDKMGFKVVGAYQNSIEALVYILDLKPNLIITDIRMPKLSGLDLMKKIREHDLKSEIIVLSGYADFEFAQTAISYNVAGYCLKPIDIKEAIDVMLKVKNNLDKKNITINPETHDKSPTVKANTSNFCKMINYIDSNFQKDLNLGELAEKFHFNPNYCCSLFRRHKQTTFSQYLSNLRIKEAKHLITSTQYTLTEVANLIGFNDYFYFSKVFKKSTGLTPKEFRSTNKE